jgi:predicted RNA-binding Zn ribbon-like protein
MLDIGPLELVDAAGVHFRFDPGTACLALACSGGEAWRARWEQLHEPSDLAEWVEQAFHLELGDVDDAAYTAARRLRNALWECVDARLQGNPLPAAAVSVINAAANGQRVVEALDDDRRTIVGPVPVEHFLASIATDAVRTFDERQRDRLRVCAGHNCFLVFLDKSRGRARAWCSMQRCGNRAKVNNFRHRQHDQEETA